jgi:hypothetical protein
MHVFSSLESLVLFAEGNRTIRRTTKKNHIELILYLMTNTRLNLNRTEGETRQLSLASLLKPRLFSEIIVIIVYGLILWFLSATNSGVTGGCQGVQ